MPSHRWITVVAVAVMACAVSATRASEKERATLLAEMKLPKPVELPRPPGAVVLPEDDGKGDVIAPISVRLAQDAPAGPLVARRVSTGDGRLYLGIRATGGELAGSAEVSRGDKAL